MNRDKFNTLTPNERRMLVSELIAHAILDVASRGLLSANGEFEEEHYNNNSKKADHGDS